MPTVKGIERADPLNGALELGSGKVLARYALSYVVIADNVNQGSIVIRQTAGLPLVGLTTYAYGGESDLTAVCKRKLPKRDKANKLVWRVRVEFDNDADSESQEDESNQSPTADARPAIVSWDSTHEQRVLYKDYSDPRKAVVGPSGLPFDPPVTRNLVMPVMVIERFQTTFAASTILAYEDHVNENAFNGADPGHVLMEKISAKQVTEGNAKYWHVTYRLRFAIHDPGHDLEVLNQASHYLNGSNERTPFIKDNVPFIGNLNANGTAAAVGSESYSTFKPHPSADFDNLNLI